MKNIKALFNAVVVAVSVAGSVSAVAVMVKVGQLPNEQVTDSRTVIGHRVTPMGEEVLVYAN
ncbi:hypothetical protein FDI21_gp110 [Pseudomonas phage Noxifer]|uniref:Uncharacterized protein n=1 Tax=Pseudomonas phage Noxifer TaxID=2006684 RepID=A0A1Y0T0G0_9CAUD|nr:hypothetical protein FDI21_gp110 [Pseudomonas phage Noxifer]ARV77279.1 hypothetical protein NOXIFER_110 [Pseudomonas phage Noxifer]